MRSRPRRSAARETLPFVSARTRARYFFSNASRASASGSDAGDVRDGVRPGDGARRALLGRKVLEPHGGTGRHEEDAFDEVLELADVAGPAPRRERLERRGLERLRAPPALPGDRLGEVRDEERDVLGPLRERRHDERDDGEAEVEVLAERAGADHRGEVAVRGRDDPHVRRHRLRAADARDLPVLDRAEDLRLRPRRHVADLVEEERPAVGLLPLALAVLEGARERPLHVAEELALDELLGDRGAVDLDERARGARRGAVQRPRDELLARPALAGDEDARVRGARPRDLGLQARHRGALAEEDLLLRGARVAVRELAPEVVALAREARALERLLERQEDALEREGLLEEVVRARA